MKLIDAIRSGDWSAAFAALDEGQDPNEPDEARDTPLLLAAASGNVELVKRLLAAGGEPMIRDAMGETPILKAAAYGPAAIVAALAGGSSEEDCALARTMLRGLPEPEPAPDPGRFAQGVATVAARTSKFFGDEKPQARMDRLERAKKR